MKSSYTAIFLAFSIVLMPEAVLASAQAASTSRYYVQTNKAFWRNAFGARNIFEEGFTADLSDLQVRVAKLAGLKPISVKHFDVMADEAVSTPTPQPTPASSISWGVQYILNDQKPAKIEGGQGVKIALVDTGIDTTHPDLRDRFTKCTDYADTAKPFIDQECADDNGHGTHMAGIAVADGGKDGQGMWGLAPQAELLVYKACNSSGSCYSDDIAKAMEGAVNDGANIIMLGFGGEADSSFIDDAVAFARDHDVLVIAPAGNDGPDNDELDWPAMNPAVISVGAIDSDSQVADFSARGINSKTKSYHLDSGDVELAAPGVNIESTYKDGGYAILSGTSMAVPHVAGLAARIWQSQAEHPAQATRELLHQMARDIGLAGEDDSSGWGVPTE